MAEGLDLSGLGPWSLPVKGYVVEHVELSQPVVLLAREQASGRQFKVHLNIPFAFRDEAGRSHEITFDVDDWLAEEAAVNVGADEVEQLLAPLRGLQGDPIDYATVWPSSELHIEM
jgi:hypothetical protein